MENDADNLEYQIIEPECYPIKAQQKSKGFETFNRFKLPQNYRLGQRNNTIAMNTTQIMPELHPDFDEEKVDL